MTFTNKKHIVVLGVVHPSNIGDGLQQAMAIYITKKILPDFNVTLMAPSHQSNVFSNIDLKASFISSSNVRLFALYNAMKKKRLNNKFSCEEEKLPIVDISSSFYNLYTRIFPYIFPISKLDEWVALSTLKGCSYLAGFIAGHTISTPSVHHYVLNYEILHKLVKGPIVTFPLSISVNAFKILSEWNKYHVIKKLRQIFRDSYVFVRGPLTLNFMKETIGLENVKMALDSGFGIKELISLDSQRQQNRRHIVIAPRRDFHYYYGKSEQYKYYLNLISNMVLELIEDKIYDVYILTPTGFLDAIKDLLLVLRKKIKSDNVFNERILISKVTDLVDACKILSSAEFVLTSYMHVGIIAMSFGTPALFLQPAGEVKLLDVFHFLEIPPLIIDTFNIYRMKKTEISEKLLSTVSKTKMYRNLVKQALEKKYSTLYDPINYFVKELSL